MNVFVYAFREDATSHDRYRDWLAELLGRPEPYGYSELALSGFVRVVTHSRVFVDPAPIDRALDFCAAVREQPNAVAVAPGPRHWPLFADLCAETGARGNLVADAYLAALCIESGSTWATADRDFSRFRGLDVLYPLEART